MYMAMSIYYTCLSEAKTQSQTAFWCHISTHLQTISTDEIWCWLAESLLLCVRQSDSLNFWFSIFLPAYCSCVSLLSGLTSKSNIKMSVSKKRYWVWMINPVFWDITAVTPRVRLCWLVRWLTKNTHRKKEEKNKPRQKILMGLSRRM